MSHIDRATGRLLASALFFAAQCASAGYVLEYEVVGECAVEFDRMQIEGLHARIDMTVDGMRLSTLYDDEEQLVHQLMHETRMRMTLESDDDAVDFQSDVGKSSLIAANKQVQGLTGMSNDQLMADYRASQIAACPEMAEIGFGDPDYAEAATRCAEKMAQSFHQDPKQRRQAINTFVKQGKDSPQNGRINRSKPSAPATSLPAFTTTRIERGLGHESIAGFSCDVEREMRGDSVLREQCVSAIDSLGLSASAVRRLKRIIKVGQGMSAGIAGMQPGTEDFTQPTGIALRRQCFRNGKASGSATMKIQRDARIDPASFEVPADYAVFAIDPKLDTQEPLEALQQSATRRD
jgi:hypothetical protein